MAFGLGPIGDVASSGLDMATSGAGAIAGASFDQMVSISTETQTLLTAKREDFMELIKEFNELAIMYQVVKLDLRDEAGSRVYIDESLQKVLDNKKKAIGIDPAESAVVEQFANTINIAYHRYHQWKAIAKTLIEDNPILQTDLGLQDQLMNGTAPAPGKPALIIEDLNIERTGYSPSKIGRHRVLAPEKALVENMMHNGGNLRMAAAVTGYLQDISQSTNSNLSHWINVLGLTDKYNELAVVCDLFEPHSQKTGKQYAAANVAGALANLSNPQLALASYISTSVRSANQQAFGTQTNQLSQNIGSVLLAVTNIRLHMQREVFTHLGLHVLKNFDNDNEFVPITETNHENLTSKPLTIKEYFAKKGVTRKEDVTKEMLVDLMLGGAKEAAQNQSHSGRSFAGILDAARNPMLFFLATRMDLHPEIAQLKDGAAIEKLYQYREYIDIPQQIETIKGNLDNPDIEKKKAGFLTKGQERPREDKTIVIEQGGRFYRPIEPQDKDSQEHKKYLEDNKKWEKLTNETNADGNKKYEIKYDSDVKFAVPGDMCASFMITLSSYLREGSTPKAIAETFGSTIEVVHTPGYFKKEGYTVLPKVPYKFTKPNLQGNISHNPKQHYDLLGLHGEGGEIYKQLGKEGANMKVGEIGTQMKEYFKKNGTKDISESYKPTILALEELGDSKAFQFIPKRAKEAVTKSLAIARKHLPEIVRPIPLVGGLLANWLEDPEIRKNQEDSRYGANANSKDKENKSNSNSQRGDEKENKNNDRNNMNNQNSTKGQKPPFQWGRWFKQAILGSVGEAIISAPIGAYNLVTRSTNFIARRKAVPTLPLPFKNYTGWKKAALSTVLYGTTGILQLIYVGPKVSQGVANIYDMINPKYKIESKFDPKDILGDPKNIMVESLDVNMVKNGNNYVTLTKGTQEDKIIFNYAGKGYSLLKINRGNSMEIANLPEGTKLYVDTSGGKEINKLIEIPAGNDVSIRTNENTAMKSEKYRYSKSEKLGEKIKGGDLLSTPDTKITISWEEAVEAYKNRQEAQPALGK